MIATYGWKLNSDLIYKNIENENILDVIEKYEFPVSGQAMVNFKTISEKYPTSQQIENAEKALRIGKNWLDNKKYAEAARHYEKALTLLERFRSPNVMSYVKFLYYGLALCCKPIKAISQIKALFLIGEESKDFIQLYEYEKSEEKKVVDDLTKDYREQGISGENCEVLVVYLLSHPTAERINKAKKIVKKCLDKNSRDLIARYYMAKCYMADGLYESAFDIAKKIENKDTTLKNNLRNWRILTGLEIEPIDPLFGNDDYESLDMFGIVNRGFSLFVNAIYSLALRYFNLALQQSPTDPFALFGQALTLWKFRKFGLAKRQIDKAVTSLEKYPKEFRFLTFSRSDETEPPKSYFYNPIYPIFNMAYCKAFIERLDPFVSYAVIP